jgi:amidohydrolase
MGKDHVIAMPATLGSEDFGFIADQVPSFYFRLGVRRPGDHIASPLHTPGFFADESCLPVGVRALVTVALAALRDDC